MAGAFGVSPLTGAFALAWVIPNLFRRLFGEGAVSAAIQPALASAEVSGGVESAKRLYARFHGFLALVVIGLCLCGELAIGLFSLTLAPDESRTGLILTASLLPYVVPICLCALAAAPQQMSGRYSLPALAPAILNMVWITTLLSVQWLQPQFPNFSSMRWLCAGILVGGTAQWLMQLPGVRASGYPVKPSFRPGDGNVRKTALNFAPALLGLAAVQINLAIDVALVRFLVDRSANYHTFLANRLLQLPLALVGIAAATGTLPLFARLSAQNRMAELNQAVCKTCELTLLVIVAAAMGMFVTAKPIIAVLFEHGRFEATDTHTLAITLQAYLWGLPAAALLGLFTRVHQSRGNFRLPAWIAVMVIPVNLILNLILLPWIGVSGAGYATAVALWTQMLLLLVSLPRSGVKRPFRRPRQVLFVVPGMCSALMAVSMVHVLGTFASTVWGLAMILIPSVGTGFFATRVFLPIEFDELIQVIRRRRS